MERGLGFELKLVSSFDQMEKSTRDIGRKKTKMEKVTITLLKKK